MICVSVRCLGVTPDSPGPVLSIQEVGFPSSALEYADCSPPASPAPPRQFHLDPDYEEVEVIRLQGDTQDLVQDTETLGLAEDTASLQAGIAAVNFTSDLKQNMEGNLQEEEDAALTLMDYSNDEDKEKIQENNSLSEKEDLILEKPGSTDELQDGAATAAKFDPVKSESQSNKETSNTTAGQQTAISEENLASEAGRDSGTEDIMTQEEPVRIVPISLPDGRLVVNRELPGQEQTAPQSPSEEGPRSVPINITPAQPKVCSV